MDEIKTINLLIFDNHDACIIGIKNMLSFLPYKFEYWQTKDKEEMIRKIKGKAIELIIACIRRDENNFFDDIIDVQMRCPNLKILVITDSISEKMLTRLIKVKITGIISDTHSQPELCTAVSKLMANEYAYNEIATRVSKNMDPDTNPKKEKDFKNHKEHDIRVKLLQYLQLGKMAGESIAIGFRDEKHVTNTIAALKLIFKVKTTAELV